MVIDSHVLYWWLDGHPRLSARALRAIEAAADGGPPLLISAVTFWEFGIKERRGQFRALRPVREWPDILKLTSWLRILPTDTEIWLRAAELDWQHRDPADRIIAATALVHNVPVLSKDDLFHQPDCPVEVVW
ncbi:MAG: type II toxin-antitoxin system VapC family toxin [Verrucomicrobia bacterium]|nr:type II toxin-antitoxin system VapC family toxin [Verrucomicrobiota bacterium]